MKAILEFNLPEDRGAYTLAYKAGDMHSVLYKLATELRNASEYSQDPDTVKAAEHWSEVFWDICVSYGVDPIEDGA